MASAEQESQTAQSEEVERLRTRVAELEACLEASLELGAADETQSGQDDQDQQSRRETRVPFDGAVQFTGDFNLFNATALNVSTSGICFQISKRIQFPMTFELNGRQVRRSAFLAWVRNMGNGNHQLGFEFDHHLSDQELGQ